MSTTAEIPDPREQEKVELKSVEVRWLEVVEMSDRNAKRIRK